MDILEDTVEEKYYLSQEKVRRLIEDMEERKALLFEPDEKSLKAFRENRVKRAGNIKGVFEQTGRVYLPDGCCPTVTACGGGGQQPKILQVGDIHTGYGSSGVIYSPLGSSGAVLAGHDQPKIVENIQEQSGAGMIGKAGLCRLWNWEKKKSAIPLLLCKKIISFWYVKRHRKVMRNVWKMVL